MPIEHFVSCLDGATQPLLAAQDGGAPVRLHDASYEPATRGHTVFTVLEQHVGAHARGVTPGTTG